MGVINRRFHMTSTLPTYIDKLNDYFLDAIRNVTRLAIVGDEQDVIGRTYWAARFPLKTTHVPKLKELEIGYFSIQADLLDFLMAHSSTLEVRKLLVLPSVFICRISIDEFPSCCLLRWKHLAKSATASNIQQQLSRVHTSLRV